MSMCLLGYLRNMSSMRWVTAKPPNMLTAVSAMPPTASQRIHWSGGAAGQRRRDLHQGADADDAGDGVGHAHQRRVQGRRHVPHHHVADEAGQHEDREVGEEGRRRVGADEPEQRGGDGEHDGQLAGRHRFAGGAMAVAALLGGGCRGGRLGGGAAGSLGGGGGQVTSPSLITVRPRIASSSMLTLMTPSLVLHSSSA
jgi:hypothetical protein